VQPNLNDSRLDGDDFDIAAIRLNIGAHQIHDSANSRQQCIATATVGGQFALIDA